MQRLLPWCLGIFALAGGACGDDVGTPVDASPGVDAGADAGPATSEDVADAYLTLLPDYARELPAEEGTTGTSGIGTLAVLDLTGDGISEIAGVRIGAGTLDLWQVQAGGAAQRTELATGTVAGVAPLRSGDASLLAVATQGPDRLLLVRGLELAPADAIALPGPPSAIITGDIDGDRDDDVAVALAASDMLVVALSSAAYQPVIVELGLRPGVMAFRPADTGGEVLVFAARSPEVLSVFREGSDLVATSIGELIEAPPAGASRIEAWAVDLDEDGPDDFLVRELLDLGATQQLVAYQNEGALWVRTATTPLGDARTVHLVEADGDGTLDLLLLGWDAARSSATVQIAAGTGAGAFRAPAALASDLVAGTLLAMGGVTVTACIIPNGLGCGGVQNEVRIDDTSDPKAVAFKTLLCEILDLLDRFAASMPDGDDKDKLIDLVDEVRDQKDAAEIWIGDLGEAGAWTEPLSGDIVFDVNQVCAINDPGTSDFWNVIRLVLHEGAHADCMAGETEATRITDRLLEAMMKDLADPNGHFRTAEGYTAVQAGLGVTYIPDMKWTEARYRHRVNDTFEDLAEELIEDTCDGEMDFDADRMAAEEEYGGTISYPGTVDCTKRCYVGDVTLVYCGVTRTVRLSDDERCE